MISNYFPHALGTGTIKKDMTKFFRKFATPCAESAGLYFWVVKSKVRSQFTMYMFILDVGNPLINMVSIFVKENFSPVDGTIVLPIHGLGGLWWDPVNDPSGYRSHDHPNHHHFEYEEMCFGGIAGRSCDTDRLGGGGGGLCMSALTNFCDPG